MADEQESSSNAQEASSAKRKAFLLRLPAGLLEDLRGWAAQDLRSLNGHIEFLLRDALKRRRGGGDS